ncbi:sce7725 family protein [Gleimia sp. 6138-11-ORH1]|uniref:sce7725 family protein n=1 Tax=Gleimia sp. 6138-11-ORH1 TaxID=2973937 RepID=UPI00216AA513|nr:sce7725 family protein [Gleimia sp. 6138-11-ORH1]MCS4484371.1 sce7725 family protein [Gleimia sp. 6138-11-ORH1]
MYYPYLRGKQFELAALQEMASRGKLNGELVHPVIEPVRRNMAKLTSTLATLRDAQVESYLVINPQVGEFKDDNSVLLDFCRKNNGEFKIIPAILILSGTDGKRIVSEIKRNVPNAEKIALIIWKNIEFRQEDINALNLQDKDLELFFYRVPDRAIEQFTTENKMLIFDGFTKQSKNADYPEYDYFSDIPLEYSEGDFHGFGDFQTIGEGYSESGGPVKAVAIHLTYSNKDGYDVIECRHFVSGDGAVIAERYMNALSKLINFREQHPNLFIDSLGLQGLVDLYERKHFPGLGVLKKLSIMHHIETIVSLVE